MSLTAIGLAAHIQSLPDGVRIGIRFLADRFPESEARIAAALREPEAHGYLKRTRERLPSGRVVTRTVSCNQPTTDASPAAAAEPRPRPVRPVPEPPAPTPAPAPGPAPEKAPVPPPDSENAPTPVPRPPLSQPQVPDLDRHRAATDLLAGLRRHEPRLLLTEDDVRRLAPAVATWLERDARPDAVRRTLVADLPEPLTHPAGLLAHRLAALLPPPLPAAPAREAVPRPEPLQNCDGCDRAFRAPEPGHCRDCRSDLMEAA
ncbi:helix-turn-helix domain-containing protein [Streptomyces sp. NBC_00057]|uniref:helix-turn-helix domain-containing protein n=1 Tax=Streptomyces sp. NBC_00057 TaxID=2975634 RepID=UPI0032504307